MTTPSPSLHHNLFTLRTDTGSTSSLSSTSTRHPLYPLGAASLPPPHHGHHTHGAAAAAASAEALATPATPATPRRATWSVKLRNRLRTILLATDPKLDAAALAGDTVLIPIPVAVDPTDRLGRGLGLGLGLGMGLRAGLDSRYALGAAGLEGLELDPRDRATSVAHSMRGWAGMEEDEEEDEDEEDEVEGGRDPPDELDWDWHALSFGLDNDGNSIHDDWDLASLASLPDDLDVYAPTTTTTATSSPLKMHRRQRHAARAQRRPQRRRLQPMGGTEGGHGPDPARPASLAREDTFRGGGAGEASASASVSGGSSAEKERAGARDSGVKYQE
ncbi:uncharacterized protein EHS24_003829 [Apiotrichum porosum]|uniref:Uncharacterized protein n=1 Tax=Apiotrichum porosum TaxID=105984 RepID=A0A427XDV7_9TREE|nr:uncharacterized protein EHS24_003829 [Apiotrichum porosum]RSH76894.1 hypothetical protein EHS24_003829 [Apiotrichum porosum]